MGAVDPFADPAAYDRAYADRVDDVAFYRAFAREHGGPVLEIGCGNGRVLLPIAEDGVEIVGIDRSRPLVADLRRRLRPGLPASAKVADMRTFRLGRRFPLVLCTFNTVLHLTHRAEFEQFFRRVRRHLAPGGRFVFDALVPRAADLARDPRRWLRAPGFREGGVRYTHRERFGYEPLEQLLYVTTEIARAGGEVCSTTLLVHRQLFPAETEALLHYNGFAVEHVWADFTREEPELDADSLVWVTRPS
ncbi:MAG: methyltransferase domain-containing protein [Myxococcota bacterium]